MNQQSAIQGPQLLAPIKVWGSLVKFSHTIFALPFAIAMGVVASRTHPVRVDQLFWILVALVSARTAAMAFNRLVDRRIDKSNPRTSSRELPAGQVSVRSVVSLVLLSSVAFLTSAAVLGWHCFVLAPMVLFVLLFYSYTKRFTRYSHLVLGLALSLAPGGVWYALTGTVAALPMFLMAAVLCWVAGFDILYSCQDATFDKEHGLYSLPAVVGIPVAFLFSRLFHVLAVVLLVLFGISGQLGLIYFAGVSIFGALLLSQHFLVGPRNLEKIDIAFFSRNGTASVLFCLFVVLDVLI